MKLASVTINPKDFGKRFQLLNMNVGGVNRQLDKSYARRLASRWDPLIARHNPVKLWQVGNSSFIVDGQHRIYAASEFLDQPTTLPALVYVDDELDDDALTTALQATNMGKPFSVSDLLQVTSSQSIWVGQAEAMGLDISVANRRVGLSFPQILRGYMQYQEAPTSFQGYYTRDNLLALWHTRNVSAVRKVLEAMAWWEPTARGLYTRNNSIKHGYCPIGIQFALVLYNCHRGMCDTYVQRLLKSPYITALANYNMAKSNYPAIVDVLVAGSNYNAKVFKLNLKGEQP